MIITSIFLIFISVVIYILFYYLKKQLKWDILNPLLCSIAGTILFLRFLNFDYVAYNYLGQYAHYILTATVTCLALPLYKQVSLLKKNLKPILIGITTGVFTNILSIWFIYFIFNLNREQLVTLMPKSITTGLGADISANLGGIVPITIAIIVATGLVGALSAPFILKLFKIDNSVAKGVAIGTASHLAGTTKAMEMGETEGAISSLSLVICGIMTVTLLSIMFLIF